MIHNLKRNEYFDIAKHIKTDISVISGARGCGKTYSVIKYILDNDLLPFVYVRLHADELRHVVGILSEQITPAEMLIKIHKEKIETIDYTKCAYIYGWPARTLSISYKMRGEAGKQYQTVAYVASIQFSEATKGFTTVPSEYPKAIIFDEYSSYPVLKFELYLKYSDIIESYFRARKKKQFLLTNKNNFQELWKDYFPQFTEYNITKENANVTKNKAINQYLKGVKKEFNPAGCTKLGDYYITPSDFVRLWHKKKNNTYIVSSIPETSVKNPKKDISIFDHKRILYFDNEATEVLFSRAADKAYAL